MYLLSMSLQCFYLPTTVLINGIFSIEYPVLTPFPDIAVLEDQSITHYVIQREKSLHRTKSLH